MGVVASVKQLPRREHWRDPRGWTGERGGGGGQQRGSLSTYPLGSPGLRPRWSPVKTAIPRPELVYLSKRPVCDTVSSQHSARQGTPCPRLGKGAPMGGDAEVA